MKSAPQASNETENSAQTEATPAKLEGYDWAGKTICPLITHGGSGFSDSLANIRRLCPGATITEGLAVNGDDAATCDADLERWLDKIGLL